MSSNKSRSERIDKFRRSQPIEELERKWKKEKGRHSNQFWCLEWLDLAHARGKEIDNYFNSLKD